MLSENSFKELVKKYQTTEVNILREYLQHLFLLNLYHLSESEKLAFKGGTALRVIFNSPRFSEDLDFTGTLKPFHLQSLLEKVLSRIKFEGLKIKTLESKPTSGGFLSIYETEIYSLSIRIELNISSRQHYEKIVTNSHLITRQFMPAYTIVALEDRMLIKEKIEALLTRQKPRDFFDLYFILRNRLCVDEVIKYQKQLITTVSSQDEKLFTRELKNFLPKTYWNILTGFTKKLTTEINRI